MLFLLLVAKDLLETPMFATEHFCTPPVPPVSAALAVGRSSAAQVRFPQLAQVRRGSRAIGVGTKKEIHDDSVHLESQSTSKNGYKMVQVPVFMG